MRSERKLLPNSVINQVVRAETLRLAAEAQGYKPGRKQMQEIKEQETSISGDDEEIFNSEMALITRELSRLLDDLLDALGGEQSRS